MQPRAWYFRPPKGQPHGPSYTQVKAQMEAARYAAKRPDLDAETALILWRSLARAGWTVDHTRMKETPAPRWLQPSGSVPPSDMGAD